ACSARSNWEFFQKNGGRYWADVIPREHWDLLVKQVEEYARILEQEGVKVVRPQAVDHASAYKLLGFESQGFYASMPRDFLMVVGDELIEASMTWRSRYFEYVACRPLILDYWRRGAKWTVAPKPTDFEKLIDESVSQRLDAGTSDKSQIGTVITESEPCFDAADFIRAGTDIFGQRSQVTNLTGIEWLRRHLAPRGIRVHQLTFEDPRPMHIDATFVLVKPGIAVQNPERPCHQTNKFKAAGWDVIDAPMPLMNKDHPMWLGSNWLSMNVLMLDPNRVLVEAEETTIQKMYEDIGVKPIPVKMRHANSIGGGFHCWSSDIRRKGTLQKYIDWD
ncbi:Glycine amidinotransferase mitochondrial, partial [Paragonimus westermani]